MSGIMVDLGITTNKIPPAPTMSDKASQAARNEAGVGVAPKGIECAVWWGHELHVANPVIMTGADELLTAEELEYSATIADGLIATFKHLASNKGKGSEQDKDRVEKMLTASVQMIKDVSDVSTDDIIDFIQQIKKLSPSYPVQGKSNLLLCARGAISELLKTIAINELEATEFLTLLNALPYASSQRKAAEAFFKDAESIADVNGKLKMLTDVKNKKFKDLRIDVMLFSYLEVMSFNTDEPLSLATITKKIPGLLDLKHGSIAKTSSQRKHSPTIMESQSIIKYVIPEFKIKAQPSDIIEHLESLTFKHHNGKRDAALSVLFHPNKNLTLEITDSKSLKSLLTIASIKIQDARSINTMSLIALYRRIYMPSIVEEFISTYLSALSAEVFAELHKHYDVEVETYITVNFDKTLVIPAWKNSLMVRNNRGQCYVGSATPQNSRSHRATAEAERKTHRNIPNQLCNLYFADLSPIIDNLDAAVDKLLAIPEKDNQLFFAKILARGFKDCTEKIEGKTLEDYLIDRIKTHHETLPVAIKLKK